MLKMADVSHGLMVYPYLIHSKTLLFRTPVGYAIYFLYIIRLFPMPLISI